MNVTITEQQLQASGFASIESLNTHLSQLTAESSAAHIAQDWDAIKKVLDQVLTILPEHAPALTDLADYKRKHGEAQEAYDILQQVIHREPSYTCALDSLAATCNSLNTRVEGISYARRAIAEKKKQVSNIPPACQLPSHAPLRLSTDKSRNIISFSLYGDNPRYCETAIINTQRAQVIYPEWTCRFYVDKSVPQTIIKRLQQAGADVHHVTASSTSFERLFWRFYVMSDSTVDCFIIRDADSLVSHKERAAVDDWLQSKQWFHIMRDSVQHSELILAGMWGGYNGVFDNIEQIIYTFTHSGRHQNRTYDQVFLREVIFPVAQQSMRVHDTHGLDMTSLPFPMHEISDEEKTPSFHVGMNDSGCQVTTVDISACTTKYLYWNLIDNDGNQICQYRQRTPYGQQHITLALPYRYSQMIQRGEWHITITEAEDLV